ncbi:MAG: S-methyl-5-thioribose-1-phosphate isomerase [Candidatus Zixiibacteriota bacterium]|nr:MAG: S-methyl-5-thioribose-1-phosphate isomerase [candidate division Zixibacteria bacterium]
MNISEKLGFKHIEWTDDHLVVLDQRKLPLSKEYFHIGSIDDAIFAIKNLVVRGAPLIGITAAYALCLVENQENRDSFFATCEALKSVRPTAVNLSWAVNRMINAYETHVGDDNPARILLDEAAKIHREDSKMCEEIGLHGNDIIPDECRILTHCNAGALATGGIGTALGVIYTAFFSGKTIEVWINETRPVLQGARLTAWELARAGVPHTLISDNASGKLMSENRINLVIVGADRVAKNLDFANKIGTYNLAVLANYHNIPFYCAAPTSTFDHNCPDGGSIEIEKRDADEIRKIFGAQISNPTTPAYNPAFDVTPGNLLTGIITENGIITP